MSEEWVSIREAAEMLKVRVGDIYNARFSKGGKQAIPVKKINGLQHIRPKDYMNYKAAPSARRGPAPRTGGGTVVLRLSEEDWETLEKFKTLTNNELVLVNAFMDGINSRLQKAIEALNAE